MWIDILMTIVTMAFALTVVISKKTVVAAFALLMTLISIGMIYFQSFHMSPFPHSSASVQ